jgi:predicted 3-demethylubiquinone-9 3-methyltransferase (glyoxalase superfamily)
MTTLTAQKIVPHFWYAREAEEAARFYTSVFPDSHIDRIMPLPADSPIGPAGSVVIVEFTLFGQAFMAMSAGQNDPFNEAISLLVNCGSQAEIDRYWAALADNGGKPQACGWIVDKYGVRWQIVPSALLEMMADADRAKAGRVAVEMQRQVKFDIAELERAFNGH